MLNKCRLLAVVLLVMAGDATVCRAEWGWPPPGYDVATLRSYDGRVYRGLCAKWRDRKNGVMPGAYTPCAPPNAVVSPAPQPELLPPPKLNGQK